MRTRGRPRHPDILTPRQWDVLALLRRGLTNEEIARELNISTDGVKYHVSDILNRLGVESRHEAAEWQPAATSRSRFALLLAPIAALPKLNAAGYAATGAAAIAVAAGIALLAWGVFRSNARQDAAGGLNDQIVFTTQVREVSSLGRTAPVWNLATYDTAEHRTVHSFEVGGEGDLPTQAVLAGDKIVVNLETRIVEYDLDGAHPRELRHAREGGSILGIGASPDGTLLAITEQTQAQFDPSATADPAATVLPYSAITNISVITLASGDETFSLAASDQLLAGYRGQPALVRWRDDGRGIIVVGLTQSEAPGSFATIMLDRSVVLYDLPSSDSLLAPNARFAILDTGSLVCGLGGLAVRHSMPLRSLDSNATVYTVQDDVLNFEPVEWAPDGSQLLYRSYAVSSDPARPDCIIEKSGSSRYHVLPTDGSAPFDIAGVAEARKRWYGDQAIEYRCHTEVVTQAYCTTPQGVDDPIDAYVNGALIATGRDFRLIPKPARTSTAASDPATPMASAAVESPRRTGIPEVDRVIDLLVHQNVDGLLELAQYAPIACSTTQTVGNPPPCAPGKPEGSPVDAFSVTQCEGSFITNVDQLKADFGLALQRQPSVAVYAVLRDNSQDRTRDSYWIAVTQDRPSQATANVSFWNVAADGRVVALQNECGPIGAAQQTAYRFPVNPDFVLGPFNNCSPPPGDTANFMITVDGLSPGGIKPQFWGEARSTIGDDTGERAIVTVNETTRWGGDISRLEDARPGMELQAVGKRQPDCTILAETILSPQTPRVYRNDALGIELRYSPDWGEGAAPMPLANCGACTVLGPKVAIDPFGIEVYTQPGAPGCTPSCSSGNNSLPQGDAAAVTVAGHRAGRQEFERQQPAGPESGTDRFTYHEIRTVIDVNDQALVVVGFFRTDDAEAEAGVRSVYDLMLKTAAAAAP